MQPRTCAASLHSCCSRGRVSRSRAITVLSCRLRLCEWGSGIRAKHWKTGWHSGCTIPRVTARPRVIVSLSNPTEAEAVADWLRSDGFEPVVRSTAQAAAAEMLLPFALLIADVSHRRLLPAHRGRHSQTPTILIGNAATASQGDALQTMYLSRPVDRAMLMCFVAMAILDARPVRRSVRKAVNRFEAVADGAPAHIVDVSLEGLRLEMARDRRAPLPPYFTLRVPIVGVAMVVQRMWTQSSTRPDATIWYGGALSQNRASVQQAWHLFVDNIPVVTYP